MGIANVVLQDEEARSIAEIEGDTYVLDALLKAWHVEGYSLLSGIDPYGDTIFNSRQMEQFLREWAQLSTRTTSDEQQRVTAEVRDLAERCLREPHLYLRFIGD